MTDTQIHHFTYAVPYGTHWENACPPFLQVEPETINVKDEDIYTGEFVCIPPVTGPNRSGSPAIYYLKRKAKDTYVFLKDYKPRISGILSRLGRLERNMEQQKEETEKELNQRDEEWKQKEEEYKNRISLQEFQIEEMANRQKQLIEKMEMFSISCFNLLHTPLKPVLVNPFD